jgi:signal transduction histidine kinase
VNDYEGTDYVRELRAEVAHLRETIERVRRLLDEGHPVDSPEERLACDLRKALDNG